ncbi:uncharacterized protein LOC125261577 [Megalobrama amblycephala]|uniref:uncharacterized protein LOC125255888 n=1 Tax=Megalobrama amblycephala TaxID=75352 RepID=UPI0020141952|nr:uncharacterized protein LOC125255888 [Megalobrama amblycephala]XP_048027363.1 uncharacterized protein LOC125255888 [Megalobrama amblycephala]XP_048036075.1 uncharacterized protein LOC125261568 [Megalobrama amblycephala]XP_048036076.1 uncharacterized protein LOC125261568 [Megalobrama amblycephala]XP_048036077.1 uncharacterized protein LOC125261568 [Megalobrama amblycephala]XP_048036089.1 uncharacterized protein LOC125261577 [Megalobrama amblycephala]XP_048036090.1 uncharacterized protein LO
MNAVNSVQLFIVVWTFTAVCRADDDVCSISCEDVTGTVGKQVAFTCSVPQKCTECCIIMYKFQYPEKYNNSAICKQEFHLDPCEQRNSFTCRYTPTTAMTGQFRLFFQTTCDMKRTEFTVDITEPSKPEIIKEAPGRKEPRKPETDTEDHDRKEEASNLDNLGKYEHERAEGRGFKVAVIAAVVSSFIIVIVPVIYKMKQNCKQKKRFRNNCQERCPVNVV